eukprot:gene1376-1739_t
MPLFQTITHTYKHLWTDASSASWRKYPSPERPDVISVDLLSKELDQETGILRCTKLIICKGSTPKWINSILGGNEVFFYEETTVDPKNQVMVLKTKNLSFTNILGVEEVCTYQPHPENKEWTLFTQEAKVTATVFGVARKMESFCLDRFMSNAGKGRKIMEDAILKVKLEAKESLNNLEATIDKTITNIKIEAENLEATIDKSLQAGLDQIVLNTSKLEEVQDEHKVYPHPFIGPRGTSESPLKTAALLALHQQQQQNTKNSQYIFTHLIKQEEYNLFESDYSFLSYYQQQKQFKKSIKFNDNKIQ